MQPYINKELLNEINTYRKSLGLNVLIEDRTTCDIAFKRLEDVKKNFSHEGFSVSLCDGQCSKIGENLAKNYATSVSVLDAWKSSPKHNELLLENYKNACVVTEENYHVLITRTPLYDDAKPQVPQIFKIGLWIVCSIIFLSILFKLDEMKINKLKGRK